MNEQLRNLPTPAQLAEYAKVNGFTISRGAIGLFGQYCALAALVHWFLGRSRSGWKHGYCTYVYSNEMQIHFGLNEHQFFEIEQGFENGTTENVFQRYGERVYELAKKEGILTESIFDPL